MSGDLVALVGPEELVAADLEARLRAPGVGAVVTFVGTVRDNDAGRAVTALVYEAHPDAGGVLAGLLADFLAAHPAVSGIAAAHRTGRLAVGEVAFVACVAAAHRREAFAAAAELVDAVKANLPIWKLQEFADGTREWVNAL